MGSDNNPDQPNIWIPESILPGYRDFISHFYAECWKTSQLVLRALALGLGLSDESFLLSLHDEKENELSFRHYPSIHESKVKSGEMDRLGAHTDFDSFTLLWQDSYGGLTVKDPNTKQWIHALPIEGALVMNIGDVLARWSNGRDVLVRHVNNLSRLMLCIIDYLISTVHKVYLPPMEQSYQHTGLERMTRPRYSIPYFVVPRHDTLMECLETCHDEDKPKKYTPMLFSDLYAERIRGFFPDKDMD